jgi:hypothetical protein
MAIYAQTANLIGSYNFDNGAVTDDSGNSNTLVASSTDIVNDILGTADGAIATRNEIASIIQFPTNFINRSEVSISFFFKTTDSGVLLGIQDRADYPNAILAVPIIYVGIDGTLNAGFWQGSVASTNVVTASTTVNDDQWHHVVLIAKSGTTGFQKVYLDNQLVGESTSGYTELAMSNAQLGSGKAQNWPVSDGNVTSFPIAASFDQVNIYDGIIDEATVNSLYNSAICVEIEADITPSTTLAGNGSISITVTSGSAPFTYLWSNGATSSSINNLTAGTYSVTITDSEACSQLFNIVVTDTEISEIANEVANTAGQINMVYKESTDETFFVYRDATSELITVKKINSDLSISNLGTVDASRSGVNPDININPVTGEPWVSFVDVNTVAVYKYDSNTTTWTKDTPGGNWNGYGVNPNKSIVQFDPAGNVYVAHVNSQISNPGTLAVATNESGSWASQTLANFRAGVYDFQYPSFSRIYADRSFTLNFSDANLDLIYSDFDKTTFNASTGFWSSPIAFASASFRTDQGLSFSNDGKYAVVVNTETDQFVIRTSSAEIAKPINLPSASSANYRQAKMIKSELDGFYYLLFLNVNNELVLEQYNELNDSWRAIASVDLAGTNPFFSYDINSTTGDFKIIYSVERASQRESSFTVISRLPEPSKLFVDKNAGAGGDGSSWSNAFRELRDALNNLRPSTEEIWVAQGTYKPSATGDINASFNINKDDLKIFGGFAGTETSLSQRNLNANTTVLSGDLADNDPATINLGTATAYPYQDNSYNVVKIQGDRIEMDGFTISGGTSVRPTSSSPSSGCAINAVGDYSSLKLKKLNIENNVGYRLGVIFLNSAGANDAIIDIENVIIKNNTSVENGTYAILFDGNPNAEVNFKNVLLVDNDLRENPSRPAVEVGFHVAGYITTNNNSALEVNIINSTFANNNRESTATNGNTLLWVFSDGTSTDRTNIHNSIFTDNFSVDNLANPTTSANLNLFQPGAKELVFTYNISSETSTTLNAIANTTTVNNLLIPSGTIFASPNDYKLSASSIAIDAGDNSKVPVGLTTDLLGANRILQGTVDLGAYEYRIPNTTPPTVVTQNITVFLDDNGNASISPMDLNDGTTDDDTSPTSLVFSVDINSFTCDDLGPNTVTLSVADFDNNIGTATAIVTVEDDIAPVIRVQNLEVRLDGTGNVSITPEDIDNGSTDNCSINSFSLDKTDFTLADLGQSIVVTLTAADANGNSSSAFALVTILPSRNDQTISFESIADKTYGDPSFAISASSSSELEVGLVVTKGSASIQNGFLTIEGAGEIEVAAFQEGNEDFNPADSVKQRFTVARKELIITADDKSIIFGENIPTLTASIIGLVYEDSEAIVENQFELSTNATANADAGEYSITVSPSSNQPSVNDPILNYTLSFVNGRLTINKADQLIELQNIADKNIGDPDFDVVATVNSGLALNYTVEGPASISGNTISLGDQEGTIIVTASQAGNLNYNAASVSVSFELLIPCEEFTAESIQLNATITNSSSIFGNGSIVLNVNGEFTYEWDNGATTSTIENLAVGVYKVKISNEQGCYFEESFSVGGITAANDAIREELVIFPNPSNNFILIKNTEEGEILTVIGASGAIIEEKIAEHNITTLDLSQLEAGVYMLKRNKKNKHYRFIKTK